LNQGSTITCEDIAAWLESKQSKIDFLDMLIQHKDDLQMNLCLGCIMLFVRKWVLEARQKGQDLKTRKTRLKYWNSQVRQNLYFCRSWLMPFEPVIHVDWLYRDDPSEDKEVLAKKTKMRAPLDRKFILTADLVYLHIFQKLEENPADDPEELYKRASLVS
jgi:hypothetical protein